MGTPLRESLGPEQRRASCSCARVSFVCCSCLLLDCLVLDFGWLFGLWLGVEVTDDGGSRISE